MKKQKVQKLSLEDFKTQQELIECEILSHSRTESKNGDSLLFLKVKDGEDSCEVGFFGKDLQEELLPKHGRKNGKKRLMKIPSDKLTPGKMEWINNSY